MINDEDMRGAHRLSDNNRASIETGAICGCYYCRKTFDPKKSPIKEWVDDGATALCPLCGVDSVISTADLVLAENAEFLTAMHDLWFTEDDEEQEPYTIEFTPLAKAVAERHGGVAKLEAQIRDELADGPTKIEDLFFHTAVIGSVWDKDAPQFVCKPKGKGTLLVEASAGPIEMDEEIKEGPFKGKKILVNPEAFD